jgi:uncharacterized phiE125 gp8 family phage protein
VFVPALITAPTADVISLEEAKAQLRIAAEDESQDDLIEAIVAACVAQLDPAAGGWLGRALRPQTWELRLDQFPACEIELPHPPLISVDSFVYDDSSGVEQTMAVTTNYRIFGQGTMGKASLRPPYNGSWPTSRSDFESVRVRFTCGYDETADPDMLPTSIKQAVHLMVRHVHSVGEKSLFQSGQTIVGLIEKSWIVSEAAGKVIRQATENLLSTQRVW